MSGCVVGEHASIRDSSLMDAVQVDAVLVDHLLLSCFSKILIIRNSQSLWISKSHDMIAASLRNKIFLVDCMKYQYGARTAYMGSFYLFVSFLSCVFVSFSYLCRLSCKSQSWLILINCVLPWVPHKEFPDRPEIRISEKSWIEKEETISFQESLTWT